MKPTPKTYLLSAILLFLSVVLLLTSWDSSVSITGLLSVVDVAPKGFEFETTANASQQAAFQSVLEMQETVTSMEEKNYSVSYAKDALLEANISYHQGNYAHVFKIRQLILFVEARKDEFADKSKLFSQKQQELQQQEIYSNESEQFFQQAGEAFRNEQLDEAFTFLEQAELELQKAKIEHSRLSELIKLSKSFLRRNWWKIIMFLVLFSVIFLPVYRIIKKKILQRKLISLREEYKKTEELVKRLQKECFIEKKISVTSYKIKAVRYEERLSEIKHTLPVIEEQLRGKKGEGGNGNAKKEKKRSRGVLEITK